MLLIPDTSKALPSAPAPSPSADDTSGDLVVDNSRIAAAALLALLALLALAAALEVEVAVFDGRIL
jgi:hypothetical protein